MVARRPDRLRGWVYPACTKNIDVPPSARAVTPRAIGSFATGAFGPGSVAADALGARCPSVFANAFAAVVSVNRTHAHAGPLNRPYPGPLNRPHSGAVHRPHPVSREQQTARRWEHQAGHKGRSQCFIQRGRPRNLSRTP